MYSIINLMLYVGFLVTDNMYIYDNPFNTETTFVYGTRTQKVLKSSKSCTLGIRWKALIKY